ncbi:uroporphyrinogen-III synthase [Leucobacter insecticola]|uniref:Uroporphyrinogen-III synthase n=1 Tax=Leucobacter insecticola TaxID=2714934 RepID=A0A6G8FGK8_9MICO|nr:uroporphyrinogen-III synthase [Leucobacter insecticola]QIM15600.1 uroporphyrinogen-III synthase [Leucobacter insecticola]
MGPLPQGRVEIKGLDTSSPSLNGARLLILRGGPWGEQVAARVRERGGVPVIRPLIEIVPERTPELPAAVARWNRGDYDWVILTSANAVAAVVAAGVVAESVPRSRVAAVGPGTASAAEAAGIAVDLVPESNFSTDGLLTALEAAFGAEAEEGIRSFLLPLSNLSDERLQTRLRAAGHLVERVTAYRTVEITQDEESAVEFAEALVGCEAVLVTSGSAARALASRLSALPESAIAEALPTIAAIGAPTAAALAGAGIQPQIVAPTQTIDGLLDAVADQLSDPQSYDPSQK